MQKKIFVSIASYKDSELLNTVESVLNNARYPDRLVFGICNQDIPENLQSVGKAISQTGANVKLMNVVDKESQGCCWARSKVQSLITDESLYLQLDSHHRMPKHWDTECEQMLENAQERSAYGKAVLSSYATICDKVTDETDKIMYEGFRE